MIVDLLTFRIPVKQLRLEPGAGAARGGVSAL